MLHTFLYNLTHIHTQTHTHTHTRTQFWALAALELDVEQPSFDCTSYAATLSSVLNDLKTSSIGAQLTAWNIPLDYLTQQISAFNDAAVALHTLYSSPTISLSKQAQISNRMMFVERAFLSQSGLPRRPLARHVIFAPSSLNSYASSAFPGIVDAVLSGDSSEAQRQVFVAGVAVQNARTFLLEGLLSG